MRTLRFRLSGHGAVFLSPRRLSLPVICVRPQRKPECTSRTVNHQVWVASVALGGPFKVAHARD